MHELIPHSGWRTHYIADTDVNSPFYDNQGAPDNGNYHRMYDFIIHPEWDHVGCETLFVKLIFVDYQQGFGVIELLGEWNDTIHNDMISRLLEGLDAPVKVLRHGDLLGSGVSLAGEKPNSIFTTDDHHAVIDSIFADHKRTRTPSRVDPTKHNIENRKFTDNFRKKSVNGSRDKP